MGAPCRPWALERVTQAGKCGRKVRRTYSRRCSAMEPFQRYFVRCMYRGSRYNGWMVRVCRQYAPVGAWLTPAAGGPEVPQRLLHAAGARPPTGSGAAF